MKKLLIGILLILFVINVDAQWYYRKYGVIYFSDLTEMQLKQGLQISKRNIALGISLTTVGVVTIACGTGLMIDANKKKYWDDELAEGLLGAGVIFLGMIPTIVGISIWVVNANRKNSIEVALVKFNTTSFLGNNQSTYFGYKQPTALGVSVKISF